ncbi:MAG: glycoside hydrolase family 31 protein, partial [Rhodothermales bacterium]|nr:glycoside hydrolase family 31 protein [Rhodothermales bacterium]
MIRTARLGLLVVLAALPAQAQPDSVATDRLVLRIDPEAGSLTLVVRSGPGSIHKEVPVPGLTLDGVHQRGYEPAGPRTWQAEEVRMEVEALGPRTLSVTWTPRAGEGYRDFDLHLRSDDWTRYYGTGERFNALDQRGYILPNRTDDRYGNKGVGTHKPIPFFMSTQGFGVWVDTFAPGLLDLSGTERFETHLRFRERALRVVFFGGPSLAHILDAFTAQTGRPRVPPPWAFGLWKSRDKHHNTDSVYVDVEKLRAHDIPASVLVLDSPWEVGYNDFEVNRQQFANADEMFADIERQGLVLCLWLTPFVNHTNVQDAPGITDSTSTYAGAAAAGYLVEDA